MLFFRRKRLFVILVGFIILVGLIGFSLRDREELTTIEEFFHDAVGWMQSVVHVPVEFTTNIIANIEDIRNVYEENQVLKTRLSQYQTMQYEVQELRQDNEELQSIIDKTESIQDLNPIQATTIARSPEQWFKQIRINKGKQHGIVENMAVLSGDGMIGKVQETAQFTSTVLLLNGFDRTNRISVNIDVEDNDQDVSGFIVGYDEERESLLLELTDYNTEVHEDEVVFTSGLGGVFPKGLKVGTIKEVTLDRYGLAQLAYVTPSADLNEVNHVIVVERLLATLDEGSDTQEVQEGTEEESEVETVETQEGEEE